MSSATGPSKQPEPTNDRNSIVPQETSAPIIEPPPPSEEGEEEVSPNILDYLERVSKTVPHRDPETSQIEEGVVDRE